MAGPRLLYSKTGDSVTVTVLEREDSCKELRINDVPEVPTDYGSLQTFHLLAHLPCLLHENPQRAVVLCFGAGITTGAMTTHNLHHIDAVEVCPEVIEANQYFLDENQHVLADDRVHVILDEGRNYLQRSSGDYDVIVCDSTHPRSSDSWMLYTREFYELCRQRLSPDGVVCQWLPIHGLTPSEYKRIVKTFLSVFPDASLWFVNRFTLLLGTLKKLVINFDRFDQRLKDEKIRDDLRRVHLDDTYAFLSCFVADHHALTGYTRGVRIITDHSPLAQHSSPERLSVDTKILNLSDLLKIRTSVLSLLDPQEKLPTAVKNKLRRYFEAREHSIQGRIFCFEGKYEEEKDSYHKALKIVPSDRDTRFLLKEAEWNLLLIEGRKCVEAAAYEKAREVYRRALMIKRDSATAHYNLGMVHLKMGLYDGALKYFRKALEIVPWNSEAHYNLAVTYWKKGMIEDCRKELEQALSLDPEMQQAKRTLAKLKELHF
jgi:spermidine synthase/predicted negative regulator of RcsB-dependent stress response